MQASRGPAGRSPAAPARPRCCALPPMRVPRAHRARPDHGRHVRGPRAHHYTAAASAPRRAPRRRLPAFTLTPPPTSNCCTAPLRHIRHCDAACVFRRRARPGLRRALLAARRCAHADRASRSHLLAACVRHARERLARVPRLRGPGLPRQRRARARTAACHHRHRARAAAAGNLIDADAGALVVALRGTMHLEDLLADTAAQGARLGDTWRARASRRRCARAPAAAP